jgi:UDP-2,3-diacylglucosamine pyrophosphatase LpxH
VVVSDVHLSYERSDTVAFESFLDTLLTQKLDQLVLLGDIFDFWRRSDADLQIENQRIIEKLLQLPLVYVHGNHDYSMLKLSGRFPEQPGFKVVPSWTIQTQQRFVLRHGYDLEVFTSMETIGLDASTPVAFFSSYITSHHSHSEYACVIRMVLVSPFSESTSCFILAIHKWIIGWTTGISEDNGWDNAG